MKLSRTHGSPLLEAFAAEDGPALRGTKWNGRFFTALRTTGARFRAHRAAIAAAGRFSPFGFATFAALGFVLEPLVGEEHLFSASEYELGGTLRTF
jgi:hypothetical protein